MLVWALLAGHSQAENVNVFGSIDPIIIPQNDTSLTLLSYSVDTSTDPDTFTLLTSGNLNFGVVDMTVNGIYANTPSNGGYGDVAHRAGSRYNDLRFYVGNNQDRYTVQFTMEGSLFNLPHPASSHPEGSSPIHLTTYRFTDTATHGVLTILPENIRFEGVAKAVRNNIPMVLYDSGAGVLQDGFGAYVALDFLALTIPVGSYGGTATWEMIPTP